MREIAKRRDLTICENESDATHILHPPTDIEDAYARPIFRKADKCLVHFYRFPESRDNWGPLYPPEEKEPLDFGEEVERREERYHVSSDWLYELEEYNEYLPEEDFLVDESGKPVNHELLLSYDEFTTCEEKPNKKKGKKRGRSPSPKGERTKKGGRASGSVRSKRQRTATDEEEEDEEEEEEDLTADMEDPAPENAITEVKVTAANAGGLAL